MTEIITPIAATLAEAITPLVVALAAALASIALYLDLRRRHARLKQTLDRVVRERNLAQASLWSINHPPLADQLSRLRFVLGETTPFQSPRDLLAMPPADGDA